MTRTCTIECCDQAHYARELCKTHYNRWWDQQNLTPPRPCEIANCDKPVHGHGICETHYRRRARHGDPLWERPVPSVRFWAKVDRSGGPDACWPWTAGLFASGYGQFKVGGRPRGAHVYAYEMVVGPVPAGLELDHRCHTDAVVRRSCRGGITCLHRRCVNPAHMEPVTQQENTRRRVSTKGRRKGRRKVAA